jgi:sporulation-control protein
MVRTELSVSRCQPGGQLEGMVEVTAGEHPIKVGYVAFTLLANGLGFHTCEVVEGFSLAAGQRRLFDVTCAVPWETPVSMPGVEITLRTELELARAVDRSDHDPVQIDPAPAQQRILEALAGLGFHLVGSNVERGRLVGLPQTLEFYQEIVFLPSKPYSHRLNRIEVTFVATREKVYVVVEADRRVNPLAGRDVFGRFAVDPENLDTAGWPALLDEWLGAI